jgi:hypothetical protein
MMGRHAQPHAVFLDWDRTLCTTRTGGSPLVGKHSLDPDLHGLLVQFARRAHIVTRNSMRDDIAAFLVSQVSHPCLICASTEQQVTATATAIRLRTKGGCSGAGWVCAAHSRT